MNSAYTISYVACFVFLVNVTFLNAHFHNHYNHHTVSSCGDSTLHHEKLNQQKIYETHDHNDNQLNEGRKLGSAPEHIRIKILYDHYANDKYMCTKVGQAFKFDYWHCQNNCNSAAARTCDNEGMV